MRIGCKQTKKFQTTIGINPIFDYLILTPKSVQLVKVLSVNHASQIPARLCWKKKIDFHWKQRLSCITKKMSIRK